MGAGKKIGSICLFFFFFCREEHWQQLIRLEHSAQSCYQFLTCVTWIHPHHQPTREELYHLHLTEEGSETQQGELLTQPLGRSGGGGQDLNPGRWAPSSCS